MSENNGGNGLSINPKDKSESVSNERRTDISLSSLDDLPDDEFYFESDHLALRGNRDYLNMLKTISLLEAQRIKAVQDIDALMSAQEKALRDPIKFVEKLQNGEDLGLPSPQVIAEIPEINWSQYGVNMSAYVAKPLTRNFWKKDDVKPDPEPSDDKSKILVRGRAFDDSKPETFNQLWTVEEQLRLEELLIKYPEEEIETNRWKKIAAALGNRTPKQVCSRVQKYFIKLMKAGLPVPGRLPRRLTFESQTSKKNSHRHQKNNHLLYRPTTFFPSHSVPVYMSEFDDEPSSNHAVPDNVIKSEPQDDDASDDEQITVPAEVKESEDYLQFALLNRVKKDKEKYGTEPDIEHDGYKCDFCQEDPIIGTRWHCSSCPITKSIDFCTDCVVSQLQSDNPHPLSHKLLALRNGQRRKKNFWDQDYAPPSFSTSLNSSAYNYLDPNFMPQ